MQRHPYRYLPIVSPIYRAVRRLVRRRSYAGSDVFCVLCERRFSSWIDRRPHGLCPNCESAPRHRFLWSVLTQEWREGAKPIQLLHIAPERCLTLRLKNHARLRRYVTMDMSAPGVDIRADLKATGLDSESFDAMICSHVLEHIPDDHAAMREMARLLRPRGLAYIQVPCNQESYETDEDPSVVDPAERTRRFGQFDHVRRYGRNIVDRLAKAGFVVVEVRPKDVLDDAAMAQGGHWNDILFRCERAERAPG